MTTFIEANTLPILLALLIGIAIGWWMFRRGRQWEADRVDRERRELEDQAASPPAASEAPVLAPSPDGPEGNGLLDQGAAATTDITGQFLGVEVHSELPGADGPPDNLQTLKGVGPKLAAKLNENGITRFGQLARLSDNDAAILDERMGPFSGRIARDRLVEQAAYLARGDTDGFEARFGKLGSGA